MAGAQSRWSVAAPAHLLLIESSVKRCNNRLQPYQNRAFMWRSTLSLVIFKFSHNAQLYLFEEHAAGSSCAIGL